MSARLGIFTGLSRRTSQGLVGAGMVLAAVVAMAATLLGAGAAGQALGVYDGALWFMSGNGEASRVHLATGKADLRYKFTDGEAGGIRLVDSDQHLLFRDSSDVLTTVDLVSLQKTAAMKLAGGNMGVALYKDVLVIVDRDAGVLQRVDPKSFKPIGDPLGEKAGLSPALVGGTFDKNGVLWAASKRSGHLYAVKPVRDGLKVVRELNKRDRDLKLKNHDLSLTALKSGAAILDKTMSKLITVEPKKGVKSTVSLPSVETLDLAESSPCGIVSVLTKAGDQVIVVDGDKARTFDVPGAGSRTVACHERVYVAEDEKRKVHVLDAETGKAIGDPLELPEAEGSIEVEVREGVVTIDNPVSTRAIIVAADHSVQDVDKSPPDVPTRTPEALPAPKTPEQTQSPPSTSQPSADPQQPQQPADQAPQQSQAPVEDPVQDPVQVPAPVDPDPVETSDPPQEEETSDPPPTEEETTDPPPTTTEPPPVPETCQTNPALCTPPTPQPNIPNWYSTYGTMCDGCGNNAQGVKLWQWILHIEGTPPNDGDGCDVDGDFQTATSRGTRGFQNKYGLDPDARVGPDTWGAAQGNFTPEYVPGPDPDDPGKNDGWELHYKGVKVPGVAYSGGTFTVNIPNCTF